MASPAVFANISHYVISYGPEGESTCLEVPNPPSVQRAGPNSRVDYIYSASSSAKGPTLKDEADFKAHQAVAAVHPHIMFPVEGASSFMMITFSPNPSSEEGMMHRTNTLDYIFVIQGSLELRLDSGENRILKGGDACVQRASMHAWKNLSGTDYARLALYAWELRERL